jgi:membrane protease YdiL (CAAX protease family)
MKKYAFWIVFFYVLLFFVILPIGGQFLGERQEAVVAYYPFLVFFNGVISFLIYFLALKGRIFENPVEQQKMPFFVYSSCALVCFGSLCLSSVIFETISYFFEIGGGIQKVIFPSSFLGWINFFFGVIFAAFFEEVIYRFYLPRVFREILQKRLTAKKKTSEKMFDNQRLSVFCEGLALLLFGLGHIYLGILGFLNALVCGAALRLCMIKTKSLWIPFGIHAVYNFLSFLILFILEIA